MRAGSRFPDDVWRAFKRTFALDNPETGVLDERHSQDKFRHGFGLGIYWDTLARWIPERARLDARRCGVPLVFLQAADECNTIDRSAALRLLEVPNMHNTGNIHGVLPIHVGMRVRLTAKMNSTLGLVQEQKARVVSPLRWCSLVQTRLCHYELLLCERPDEWGWPLADGPLGMPCDIGM